MHTHRRQRGRTPSLVLTVSVAMGVLSGCGGGGGGSDTPEAQPSALPSFRAVETSQTDSTTGQRTRQISVVDARNSRTVQSYTLDGTGPADWLVTATLNLLSPTTLQVEGQSQLFMIQNGRVMRVDLRGSTLGRPTQVSSLTQACAFANLDPELLRGDGTQPWLQVRSLGPDGLCNTPDDEDSLVLGTASATVAGVPAGPQGLEIINTLGGNTDGVAKAVLAFDHGSGVLGVYNPTDLRKRLQVITPGDQLIDARTVVRNGGEVPGNPDAVVLLIGAKLYRGVYTNGRLSLGDAIYTVSIPGSGLAHGYDANATYVVTEDEVIQVPAQGDAVLLNSMSLDEGTPEGALLLDGHLVVSKVTPALDSDTPESVVYWSVPLNGDAPILLAMRSGDLGQSLIGHDGMSLYFMTRKASGTSTISRMSVERTGVTSLLNNVHLASMIYDAKVDMATPNRLKHLVYCIPSAATPSCAGNTLQSRNVPAGTLSVLGSFQGSAGSNAFMLPWPQNNNPALFFDSTPLVLPMMVGTPTGTGQTLTTSVWAFQPGEGSSLAQIPAGP